MDRDWESSFSSWAKGPSQTEQEQIDNAERMIKEAIQASDKLKFRNITVFTQGSYRNRVNVKRDSDVDIGILCYDTFFYEAADDNVRSKLYESLVPATYDYSVFKTEIEEALVTKFGREAVSRGKKAFDIKANSYRVEADVCAFFEHRRYTSENDYISGVEMIPDDSSPPRIINWPEQHYTNGVNKNSITSRKFKRIVRTLKSLSIEMAEKNIVSARKTPSFLIESLVFNAPDS